MLDLDIYYKLQEDPDGYSVLYDLCLINGWADICPMSYPTWATWHFPNSKAGCRRKSIASICTRAKVHGEIASSVNGISKTYSQWEYK
jgi:hypothetical protein